MLLDRLGELFLHLFGSRAGIARKDEGDWERDLWVFAARHLEQTVRAHCDDHRGEEVRHLRIPQRKLDRVHSTTSYSG